jgi:hypothetical protein
MNSSVMLGFDPREVEGVLTFFWKRQAKKA